MEDRYKELKQDFLKYLEKQSLWCDVKIDDLQIIFSHYAGKMNLENGYIHFYNKLSVQMYKFNEKKLKNGDIITEFKYLS